MPKPITDELTDLHDKHFGMLSFNNFKKFSTDPKYYHEVMDAFLLDVQKLIQAARVEELEKAHRAGNTTDFDNATDEYIDERLATLNSEDGGQG